MLHDFLTRNRDEIIARCERHYRQRRPERPAEELLHRIPAFIDEVIKAERRIAGIDDHSKLPGDTAEACAQGEQRFHDGYRIDELAWDFGAISNVIGELAIEQDHTLDPRSYQMLNQCIDSGIAQSISTFFALSRERAEQETAEFIGSLGHELRNALGSATMAFSIVKSGQVGLESRTARVLERSLQRLDHLVSQTLTVVRMKSHRELERSVIRLQGLLEDVEGAAQLERGITLALAVDPHLMLEADSRLLEMALGNLVQNAIKFTHGSGRVEVRAQRTDHGVIIEVEDQCGGLGDVSSKELFRPFVQDRSKARGVGLGLSITRQAIEAHGGSLSVRDLPGKGCIFTISLPAADERRAVGEAHSNSAS
ncbi:MAG: HAMP domain-containing histidine kinase [Myxococcota bacterium]|nr:HAMP domain-containing histidine kinase [Myxococcota bacterium]